MPKLIKDKKKASKRDFFYKYLNKYLNNKQINKKQNSNYSLKNG